MKKIIFLLVAAALTVGCVSKPESDESAHTSKPVKNITDIYGKEYVLTEVHTAGKNTGFKRDELVTEGFGDFFTVSFDETMLAGVGAPNRYSAPYTLEDENGISIKLLRSTMMAALSEPEKLKEHEYFIYLQSVYKWNTIDDKLELISKTEDGADVLIVFMIKN